jgi:hypothetical protein
MDLKPYINFYLDKKKWSVFPVTLNKATLNSNGQIQKSYKPLVKWEDRQETFISKDDSKWKEANGIAIVTGKLSNLTVIDFDTDSLEIKKLPKTYTVKTNKGLHLYFKYNPKVISNSGKLIPGIDFKSEGGIVFAPPSQYELPDGKIAKYEIVLDAPLADFPIEWYESLQPNGIKKTSNVPNVVKGVIEGERNMSASQMAGSLLRKYSQNQWLDVAWPLFQAWNKQNNPPLSLDELETVWESITKIELNRRTSQALIDEEGNRFEIEIIDKDNILYAEVKIQDGWLHFEFSEFDFAARTKDCIALCWVEIPGMIQDKYEQRINLLSSSAREGFIRQLEKSFGKDTANWSLIFSRVLSKVSEILETSRESKNYSDFNRDSVLELMPPFLYNESINCFFGMGGSGKTLIALRMGLSIAFDLPFLGYKPQLQGNVLMVDYESNHADFHDRIEKLNYNFKIPKEQLDERLWRFDPKGLPLNDIKNTLAKEIKKKNIKLLIVDSAALAAGGEPESAGVANQLINALNSLKTSVFLIAHKTKSGSGDSDKYPFGSIFFYNGPRNIWLVRSDQDYGEDLIHVGLVHRKSNVSRHSSPKAIKIIFESDKIDISEESNQRWSQDLGLKQRIIDSLSETSKTLAELVEDLKAPKDQIKNRLTELKNQKKIKNTDNVWTLDSDQELF